MATLTKTNAGSWKAEIRRKGWPKVYKNFRTKRDAEDWARAKEDEMVRGSFICLLYTSPSPRDLSTSRMPSSA